MSTIQFTVAAIGAAVGITAVSLLWPILTDKPEPEALLRVRDTVRQTELGAKASDILGVESDTEAEPLNVSEWAAAQGNAILQNVSDTAQSLVVTQVVRQILTQIEHLTPQQRAELEQAICVPPEPSATPVP